jgi:uncharacterized protein (DUF983 family)
MNYTNTDMEEELQRRLDNLRQIDENLKREVRLGLRPICPICSSHRYYETAKTEHCDDCGHFVSY